MIIIEPVIETFGARDFTAWPVSFPADSCYLVLSGELTPAGVGTAMSVITSYNENILDKDGNEVPDGSSTAEALQRLTRAERLIAPGGLRVRTDTGLTVNPGCCAGLENWRDWEQVADGESPWLGHDPSPWAEQLGSTTRIWPDEIREGQTHPPAGPPVEIAADALPVLVAGAGQKLRDFLDLIEPWALPLAGPVAKSLAPALAAHFHIGPEAS